MDDQQRDAERWQRLQSLFHEAADLSAEEQLAFLDASCGDDGALRDELARLLASDASGASIFDQNLTELAQAVLAPASDSAIPHHVFGPYRPTRLLGEGGMGVVFHAERDDIGSEVALKILRDAWLSPVRRARFVAEQRTLAQLHHPSIARLFDAGTLDDGTPWIAMEYVDGVPLHDYCRRTRAGVRERLRLLRSVGEAVRYAHQLLVIHRDIKPSNVLVTADGTVKLLDFGIAKQLLAATDSPVDRTRTAVRMLTPAYAAPEQVRGDAVGMHTDVYSLGVVLYELLTGTLPFELHGKSGPEVERLIVDGVVERPSVRRGANEVVASSAMWEDLDVLCLTAMHADPARRYPSMDALLRDIDHLLAGEPLEAHADSLAYRSARFVRRHARAVTLVSVAIVTLAMTVTFYTVRLAQARDRALAESARAQRIERFIAGIFQGGDDDAGPADSLRVVTLLAQGVDEARTLDREPRVQADLYRSLGGIYRQLGQFPRADSLLLAARAQWARVAGDASVEVARADVAVAELRTDQARYDEALRMLRAATAVLAREGGSAAPDLFSARVVMGRTLTEQGEYDTAIALLDSVVVQARQNATGEREMMEALGELASAHFYVGHYAVADSLNRQVLALTRRLFGEQHPRVAEDLMNLGATEQERGNYVEAERYFRDALARTIAFHGQTHFRTAGNLVYLGRALLLQNRYPEAKEMFERSLSIREQVFGANHPTVANTLNELGSLAIKESRYEDAESAFIRVRDIYQRAYPGVSYKTGVATGNLADTYLYRKDYRRAEPMYREALTHYIATQGPEHLNTGIGYIKLGRCLMRSGRFAASVPETKRGYAIVAKVAAADVSFLQAARLDLSIALDSLGRPDEAATYRAERERYLPKPGSK